MMEAMKYVRQRSQGDYHVQPIQFERHDKKRLLVGVVQSSNKKVGSGI